MKTITRVAGFFRTRHEAIALISLGVKLLSGLMKAASTLCDAVHTCIMLLSLYSSGGQIRCGYQYSISKARAVRFGIFIVWVKCAIAYSRFIPPLTITACKQERDLSGQKGPSSCGALLTAQVIVFRIIVFCICGQT